MTASVHTPDNWTFFAFSMPLVRKGKALLAALAMSTALVVQPLHATTPEDTLVIALAIDDLITNDPAEAFEFAAAEASVNIYNKLVALDLPDTSKIVGDLAASWEISSDGLTYTFRLKPRLRFASGNPVRAADVAYSFERLIKLNKTPAFLLTQFGLSPENIAAKAKATDDLTFVFTVDKPYSPSFVLNCLASLAGMVVDAKLVQEHAEAVTPTSESPYDTDFGNNWLRTNSAGSGPYTLRAWRPNEIVVLERNENYFGPKPALARVIYRHIKESATQRLLLEKGDVDVARNLEPGDIKAVSANPELATTSALKSTLNYVAFNQKNPNLAKPDVRTAFKYLIDYDTIAKTLMSGTAEVHQTFLPEGVLGATDERPYKLDLERARELLQKAGLKDGFTVTLDTRSGQPELGVAESIQQTAAQAGIKVDIIASDDKQALTKYRARNHDIYIGQYGIDYFDPHANADVFIVNPNNADDGTVKTLAWRNAWDVPELSEKARQALFETDIAKRIALYGELQREVLEQGPFAIMSQQIEVAGMRKNVKGFKLGPSSDLNYVSSVSK